MNYIFLDIDGVLNNQEHYSKQHKKYNARYFCEDMPFNPRSLKNLYKIVKKTHAKIILTSSWRHSEKALTVLKSRLAEYGLKIDGMTEDSESHSRGQEIAKYLMDNCFTETMYFDDKEYIYPIECSYVIIDDEIYDILDHFFDDRVVRINQKKGLTWFKMRETISKINREWETYV